MGEPVVKLTPTEAEALLEAMNRELTEAQTWRDQALTWEGRHEAAVDELAWRMKEITRLRAALEVFANETAWLYGADGAWLAVGDALVKPWTIAREALGEPEPVTRHTAETVGAIVTELEREGVVGPADAPEARDGHPDALEATAADERRAN